MKDGLYGCRPGVRQTSTLGNWQRGNTRSRMQDKQETSQVTEERRAKQQLTESSSRLAIFKKWACLM